MPPFPSVPAIPTKLVPTVQCIYSVLKSSGAVQSLSLYSIDDFRFAVEYGFRNKDDQDVVSDIEFFDLGGSVTKGDKIPREVSRGAANEANEMETKLGLLSKCGLNSAFDNLLPQPKARTDWQKIDWPSEQP